MEAGHIPRKSFPLSKLKNKRFKYGPEYEWRIVTFRALDHAFSLLIMLNENKAIYRASLGMHVDQDVVVLGMHEYHSSEPGWHCHFSLQDHRARGIG